MMNTPMRLPLTCLALFLLISLVLMGCTAVKTTDADTPSATPTTAQSESSSANVCAVTEAIWLKPPEDSAVQDSAAFGHYFANEDRSILASAWWAQEEEYQIRADEIGIKVGWFRPTGAALEITGQRIDAEAAPLEAHVPCCYPTQFQATGLMFPTEGCWQVTARAAKSELSFVVWVEPVNQTQSYSVIGSVENAPENCDANAVAQRLAQLSEAINDESPDLVAKFFQSGSFPFQQYSMTEAPTSATDTRHFVAYTLAGLEKYFSDRFDQNEHWELVELYVNSWES